MSHIESDLQPEIPLYIGPPIPQDVHTASAELTHADNNTKMEGLDSDFVQSHSSSGATSSLPKTARMHVPIIHPADRYIFRESCNVVSSMADDPYFSFNSAICIASYWDGRGGRQSDHVLRQSGLYAQMLDGGIAPDMYSPYDGLVLRASLTQSDHYTYLNALYRVSEAMSIVQRESVIYDIPNVPGRAFQAAASEPDHYTYLETLYCPLTARSSVQSEGVMYDIISDLGGNTGRTSGQYTRIFNMRRSSERHTRPLFPSGEYAIPYTSSGIRFSFEIDHYNTPGYMDPVTMSSLTSYSPEADHYDTPSHMDPVTLSSLTSYSPEADHYDTPSQIDPVNNSSLANYSSEADHYDTPKYRRAEASHETHVEPHMEASET